MPSLIFYMAKEAFGKTYGISKFVVKQFIKTGEQFAYIRRFHSELKEAVPNFFKGLINNNEFPDKNLSSKGTKFYCDGEICGFAMTLTTAQNLKGTNFSKVKYIIFDEYLIEEGQHYYLKNEVQNFLGLIETISRMRDVKIFMLANSTTTTNPYFLYFDLHLPYNNDIVTFKDGLILVQYMKNEKYRKAKKETKFGKLIEGTSYEKYAVDNEFIQDTKTFIAKKTGSARFSFSVIYKENTFGIWIDFTGGLIYVSQDFIKNSPIQFAITTKDHKENTMLIKMAKKYHCWKVFIENYQMRKC